MSHPIIGVLGGVNDASDREFLAKLTAHHISYLHCPAVTAPSKAEAAQFPEKKKELLTFLARDALTLLTQGATHLVLPCGTIQLFLNELENEIRAQQPSAQFSILNLREALKQIHNKTGIIAMPAALTLFTQTMKQESVLLPHNDSLSALALASTAEERLPIFQQIHDDFATRGAEQILLARGDSRFLKHSTEKKLTLPRIDYFDLLSDLAARAS